MIGEEGRTSTHYDQPPLIQLPFGANSPERNKSLTLP